jgi:hypothetical protein
LDRLLTNDGGNGGGGSYPSGTRRAPTDGGPQNGRPKKSTYDPAGDRTDRTSHREARACTGSRADQISVGAGETVRIVVIAVTEL